MERQPVKTIPIHEHLRPRLCDTYENDSIFDKFEVVFSGDGANVMTGSYNNNFMIYPSDPLRETEVVLQADKTAFKAKKVGVPTPINSTSPTGVNKKGGSRAGSPAAGPGGQGGRMRKETDADQIDFNKKILHMSWHPFEDSIAIAATNNVSLDFSRFSARTPAKEMTSFSSFRHCRQYTVVSPYTRTRDQWLRPGSSRRPGSLYPPAFCYAYLVPPRLSKPSNVGAVQPQMLPKSWNSSHMTPTLPFEPSRDQKLR